MCIRDRKTAHFNIYYYPSSTAEKEIESIACLLYTSLVRPCAGDAFIGVNIYEFPITMGLYKPVSYTHLSLQTGFHHTVLPLLL